MAIPNPELLEYLMGLDGQIRQLENQIPENTKLKSLKSKFLELAGNEFDRSVLREMHEYTIEEIINKQANGFYSNFTGSIKKELIQDYVEMEHQLRRDKFYNFCLHVYKQIECCIRYCLNSDIFLDKLKNQRAKSLFTNENVRRDKDTRQIVKYLFNYGDTVQYSFLKYYDKANNKWFNKDDWDKVFNSNDTEIKKILINMTFPNQFKMVLYIVRFESNVCERDYNHSLVVFESIRQARHMAHGGKMSETETKVTDGIELDEKEKLYIDAHKNRFSNYLIFLEFLADFIQNVPKVLHQK
jgi:hypothetical protein